MGHPAQPPAQAGSPTAGCTAPRPGGAGISPEKETPQPLWAAWARAPSPSEGRSSSSCKSRRQWRGGPLNIQIYKYAHTHVSSPQCPPHSFFKDLIYQTRVLSTFKIHNQIKRQRRAGKFFDVRSKNSRKYRSINIVSELWKRDLEESPSPFLQYTHTHTHTHTELVSDPLGITTQRL